MGIFDGIIDTVKNIGGAFSAPLDFIGGIMRNEEAEDAADKQMKFQENMSSTAHQREVKDLLAAGLNPMLSGKYGGASTPPGASYNPEKTTQGIAQNLQAALLRSQIQKTEAETSEIKARTPTYEEGIGKTRDERALLSQQYNYTQQQVHNLRQNERLTEAQVREVEQHIRLIVQSRNTEEMKTRLLHADALIREMDIPEARNYMNAAATWWGQHAAPFMRDVARGATAAAASSAAMRWLNPPSRLPYRRP